VCQPESRFELILYGWREGGEHAWHGPETQKPLELVARAIRNSSRRGETALDVCAGSGTTLIACEQLTRRCAAVEIDPAYVDVVIERWQALTGERAILESTGQSFSDVRATRRGA
jgi:predicted RNA methylase